MKNILIVTSHYLPGYKAGGPVKSISSLCSSLQNDFNITVITSNYEFGEDEPYGDIVFDTSVSLENYKVIYLSKIGIQSMMKQINTVNPDIIYLNSFFSKFTQIVLLLKKFRLIKSDILLAPRGELSSGALSIKFAKKSIFMKIAQMSGLYNGISFHTTDTIETIDIKKLFDNDCYQIPNITSNNFQNIEIIEKNRCELKLIFLSRISSKKNLLFALEVLKMVDKKNIIFDIYGTKEDVKYWEKCDILINSFENIKVCYKGALHPTQIPKVLSQYHGFFLPTLNENFGHAIVESMQVGIIPIISDQTPWNDLQEYNAGWSLDLNNNKCFIQAIDDMLLLNDEQFKIKSNNIKKYIDMKLDDNQTIYTYKLTFKNCFSQNKKCNLS